MSAFAIWHQARANYGACLELRPSWNQGRKAKLVFIRHFRPFVIPQSENEWPGVRWRSRFTIL